MIVWAVGFYCYVEILLRSGSMVGSTDQEQYRRVNIIDWTLCVSNGYKVGRYGSIWE